MNPIIKQKWITALRSGKYRQGRARLCRTVQPSHIDVDVSPDPETGAWPREYCCLGVLCELARAERVVILVDRQAEWHSLPMVQSVFNYRACDQRFADAHSVDLPEAVVLWAGLGDSVPWVKTPEGEFDLIQLNDLLRRTFAEIADLLEQDEDL